MTALGFVRGEVLLARHATVGSVATAALSGALTRRSSSVIAFVLLALLIGSVLLWWFVLG